MSLVDFNPAPFLVKRYRPFREHTISEVLLARADDPTIADKVALVFLGRGGEETQRFTFRSLAEESLKLAHGLQRLGIEKSTPVITTFASDWRFVLTFYACQLLGAIPVPVAPPFSRTLLGHKLTQLGQIAENTGTSHIITDKLLHTPLVGGLAKNLASGVSSFDSLYDPAGPLASPANTSSESISFIQYTSGSTGGRKGVPMRNSNLTANMNSIGEALNIIPEDSGVSFLPVYHDMGLIGKVIQTLCHGLRLVQISPLSFLRNPFIWLQAISDYSGTVCAAPPFAYKLCSRRVTAAQRKQLDLRSWRVAMIAADMIQPQICEEFVRNFKVCGFHPDTFLPVYGLAECTLATTIPSTGGVRTRDVTSGDRQRTLVCVGKAVPQHQVQIWQPGTQSSCADGTEGEIVVRGSSVVSAYWRSEDGSPMAGDWLRTGDLGIKWDGELYISGRIKDVIKYHGRSIHPSEIEWIAATVDGVRAGCSAAFNLSDSDEFVVLIVENKDPDTFDEKSIAQQVTQRVASELSVDLHHVQVVAKQSVPKTTSGKVQRYRARLLFEGHGFDQTVGRMTASATAAWSIARGAVRLAFKKSGNKSRRKEQR